MHELSQFENPDKVKRRKGIFRKVKESKVSAECDLLGSQALLWADLLDV